jgi:hypothetical protein
MNYYVYFTAFFLDVAIALLTNQLAITVMRVLFYATPFMGQSLEYLILAGFLVLVESFIVYGMSGADMVIMVPVLLIITYLNKKLAISPLLKTLVILFCVLLHYLVIDYLFFLKRAPSVGLLTNFALYAIVGHVILRSSIRGNQDNRLKA